MPRFVLLRHELPPGHPRGSHWDFMIETGDCLETWALDHLPIAGGAVPATRLPNHRKAYLDFEGPLSGDRGAVARVETGEYEMVSRAEGRLILQMFGEQLFGQLTLRRRADGWEFSWRVTSPS